MLSSPPLCAQWHFVFQVLSQAVPTHHLQGEAGFGLSQVLREKKDTQVQPPI